MSLKMSKKVPKMGLKWPKNGIGGVFWPAIWGHFGPIWGVLGAFSGHLGLLDVILDRHAAAGPATRINVPSNVQI